MATRKTKTPATVTVVALTHFATIRQGFTSGHTYTISCELAEDLLTAGLVEVSEEPAPAPAAEVETASEPASEVETASAPNAADVQPDPDPADDAETLDADD